MSGIELRPYQEQAFTRTMNFWNHGGRGAAISMATGLGKAYLGLALGEAYGNFKSERPKRVAFLAHSIELIQQPYESLYNLAPYLRGKHFGKRPAAGIVRSSRNQVSAQFVFCTMQTAADRNGRRMDEILSHGAFDLVIVDEMHHIAAPSYEETIIPKILEANPDTKFLGLTATLMRSDGKALDKVLDEVVYQMNIKQGIDGGWLKPINAHSVRTNLQYTNIKHGSNGDFTDRSLASALRAQNAIEIINRAYFENDGPDHYAFSFMPSLDLVRDQCEDLRKNGIPAATIDHEIIIDHYGKVTDTPGREYDRARRYVLDAARGGDIRVTGGYQALTEGVDVPIIDLILQGRPTKSESLLTQMIGRGLRMPKGIARIVQDSEREVYLVQRNGDDKWHEYPKNNMPYATECLVLDFTSESTPILLSGSLSGNHTTPELEEVEKETEEILVTTPIPKEIDIILKRGEGTKYFKRNFFKMSSDNWTFWPTDNTMSAYLGAQGDGEKRLANALFVYPRRVSMVENMNAVLDVLDDRDEDAAYQQAMLYKRVFEEFTLWRIKNIPVNVKEKNGYTSEWVKWDAPQVEVDFLGRYPDHHILWENALQLSQELSVGGFFVDRKRSGANNITTSKQLDLLYAPLINGKFPNIFHMMPQKVNDAFAVVPGMEGYLIEKPLRKTMAEEKNVVVSGMINHVGAYSVVMLKRLGLQLVQAQQLYNKWVGGNGLTAAN